MSTFQTAQGADLPLQNFYRNSSAFLIASGPSFSRVSAADLRALRSMPGVWTATTNNATASFRGNAAIFVDEPQRFSMSVWMDPAIQKFVPKDRLDRALWDNRFADGEQKWQPAKTKLKSWPGIVAYERNDRFNPATFLTEPSVNWGNQVNRCDCGGVKTGTVGVCSKCGMRDKFGCRSVLLASLKILYCLGFRDVYLLGVDFQMDADRRYHFDEQRTAGAIACNNSTYSRLQERLAKLRPVFDSAKYHVHNCNPESGLTAFPFLTLRAALDKATSRIGVPVVERVRGMYDGIEAKSQGVPVTDGNGMEKIAA